MRILRGTLTFVLGMILGIILFVLAIGGTIVALGTSITVGELQTKANVELVQPDSEIYGKSVWDTVKLLVEDVANLDKVSLKSLYDRYGIALLNEFSGIDLTDKPFYSAPISSILNDVSIVTNSFSLAEIGKLAAINFDEYGIPVLSNNVNNNISTAVDNILSSLNSQMSVYSIKADFGIDIGAQDNALLDRIQYLNLSDFGAAINAIPLNAIVETDTDSFAPAIGNVPYVKADEYQKLTAEELNNKSAPAAIGVKKYIASAKDTDGDGVCDTLTERELRFVKRATENGEEYIVDNSCYADDFDANANTKEFFRFVEYKTAGPDDVADLAKLYIPIYGNHVEAVVQNTPVLTQKGFLSLASILSSIAFDATDKTISITADEQKGFVNYGFEDATITTDSTMTDSGNGYIRIHKGSSAAVLMRVAYYTVNELQHMDDFLNDIKIGEIVDIDQNSALIMRSLKDTRLGDIADEINNLTIDKVLEINEQSPLLLRTLADKGCKIIDFGSVIDTLTLNEVIEIDADIYAQTDAQYIASHPQQTFYYYDAEYGIYCVADKKYRGDHPDQTFYVIEKEGSSVGILKKLAYAKIAKLGDSMQKVLDDMFLSDVIKIFDSYIVKNAEDSGSITENDSFFIPAYDDEEKFAYIYDAQGKYFLNDFVYLPATSAELGAAVDVVDVGFEYAPFLDLNDTAQAANLAADNIYYSPSAGVYDYNIPLCTYLLTSGSSEKKAKLFYRKSVSDASSAEYTLPSYPSARNLYVEILGEKIPYMASNPAHAGLALLYKHESDTKEFFVRIDEYISSYNKDVDMLFSKQYTENVYFEDANGNLVYFNGEYVPYEAENASHAGLTRYIVRRGFVATKNQAYYTDAAGNPASHLSPEKIDVIQQKSPAVLRMMKTNKVTVKNMSDVIDKAKFKDIMDVTPDSIFDNESIMNATIQTLPAVMSQMLKTMTIGELLEWGNITNVEAPVRSALSDVTIPSFFNSLKYNEMTGNITVDMEKVYGY